MNPAFRKITLSYLSVLLVSLMVAFYTGQIRAQEIEIYYLGTLNGAIEPCGCSDVGELGGLKRHAVLFSQINRSKSLLLSSGGLVDNSASTEKIKADFIISGMQKLNFDAIALQQNDNSFGSELMNTQQLPWVSSNLQLEQIPASRHTTVNSIQVNIYTLAKFDQNNNAMGNIKLRSHPAKVEKKGLNILLTSYHMKRIPDDFDLTPYHIVIYGHRLEEGAEPLQVDGQVRLGPGVKGMYMGHLKGEWNDGQFEMTGHQFIKLGPDFDKPNQLSDWYQEYQDALKADYQQKVILRKNIDSGQADYKGAETCKTCHQSAYQAWSATKHARAFDTLFAAEKQFDPSCIKCHVVGFNKEGGYLDEYITPHLQGVGCESCHGPGREHIQSVGKVAMTPKTEFPSKCLSCHQRAHSPDFDYQQYWQRIIHQ